jgi:CRP-like cAMP-binding protein
VSFPLTAMAGCFRVLPDGSAAQVAMIGRDGVAGLALLAGGASANLRTAVQMPGTALAIDGSQLMQEFMRGGTVMRVLLRYSQALMAQMAQVALCNRHHSIEQQLARWLLMSMDRLGTREIAATQEAVAELLGVRREGVSEAVSRLRDAGLITNRRGRITVASPLRLASRTCGCYAVLKSEEQQVLQPRSGRLRPLETDGTLPLQSTPVAA